MKIYIATATDYKDDFYIFGVFDNKEKAQKAIEDEETKKFILNPEFMFYNETEILEYDVK